MIRRRRADHQQQRDAWRIASALLRYPDEDLCAALPAIRAAVEDSQIAHRAEVLELIDGWLRRDPLDLQREYVEVFDLGKQSALHVSWYQYGDRRQRGMVLLKLKRRFIEYDMTPVEDELPDWLPLMLEFAAEAPAPAGVELLQEWRAAIELIRRSLEGQNSAYTVLLDVVSASLPKLGANVREAVDRLIDEGPPGDEVGLEPFGPDNEMPSGLLPVAYEQTPAAVPAQGGSCA